MPWNRNDPDPLEARRRKLAEQERLLAQQRKLLTEQLQQSTDPSTAHLKPAEPPVWRMEDDIRYRTAAEPTPRNLARQRQRDRLLVFVLIVFLIIVIGIVLWVARVHNTAPVTSA
jgi:hypothetical protein